MQKNLLQQYYTVDETWQSLFKHHKNCDATSKNHCCNTTKSQLQHVRRTFVELSVLHGGLLPRYCAEQPHHGCRPRSSSSTPWTLPRAPSWPALKLPRAPWWPVPKLSPLPSCVPACLGLAASTKLMWHGKKRDERAHVHEKGGRDQRDMRGGAPWGRGRGNGPRRIFLILDNGTEKFVYTNMNYSCREARQKKSCCSGVWRVFF